jgi:hypothetical protein
MLPREITFPKLLFLHRWSRLLLPSFSSKLLFGPFMDPMVIQLFHSTQNMFTLPKIWAVLYTWLGQKDQAFADLQRAHD